MVELQLVMRLMPQCLAIYVQLLVKDLRTMIILVKNLKTMLILVKNLRTMLILVEDLRTMLTLVKDLRTKLLRDPKTIATQVVICKLYCSSTIY